jgi:hypothetical protein
MPCEEYSGYSKYRFDYYLDLILYLMSIKLFYLRESLFEFEKKKEKKRKARYFYVGN